MYTQITVFHFDNLRMIKSIHVQIHVCTHHNHTSTIHACTQASTGEGTHSFKKAFFVNQTNVKLLQQGIYCETDSVMSFSFVSLIRKLEVLVKTISQIYKKSRIFIRVLKYQWNKATGEGPNLEQCLNLGRFQYWCKSWKAFLFDKSKPILHTLNISNWFLKLKCVSVSLDYFVR